MADRLEIKLLGPPEVFYGDHPVKFATRKALALFVYLLIEAGAHPRGKLQALFWPESDTQRAQSALRTTLGRIKSALRQAGEVLEISDDRVAFNPTCAYSVDIDILAQVALDAQSKPADQALVNQMQAIASAMRGAFLDAFALPDAPAFDDWVTIHRHVFEGRIIIVLDCLSDYQLETHLIEPAIDIVKQWLILDNLNEKAHRRLMRLHFLKGDRNSALQAYQTCMLLLEKEKGLSPAPATDELIALIRSSEMPAPGSPGSPAVQTQALHIPFVGRATEFQSLVEAFRFAEKGTPKIVAISGESGIGKTRLSDEFLIWAGLEGADILRGRAYEASSRLPYQPVIDALRERLEHENAPEDLLDDAWLVELTRILPELRERYPDLSIASGDEATARTRLFEAVARLGKSLSARNPLVFLIDDLQWADVGTLELLHYLSRSWQSGSSPILILILMREEALAHGSGLHDWMSALTRDIPVSHYSLPPMESPAIEQLVKSLTGENVAGIGDLSDWLTIETNGQPFFIVETLSALEDYGALVWKSGESSYANLDPLATLANLKSMDSELLAPSIYDVILSRLEWLSRPAIAILAAAAVISRDSSFVHLRQVAGINEQIALDALDELLSARLLVEVHKQRKPYNISHDRIREVVYAQLSAARKQIFHRRALETLAKAEARPAELANHASAAENWQAAFHYRQLAGNEAMSLFELTTAISHYEMARMILNDEQVAVDTDTCLLVYKQLGKAYELEFRHSEAMTIYEDMYQLAIARHSREMELASLVARCIMLPAFYETQDLDQARELAQQALPLAELLEDMEARVNIELCLARIHKFGDKQIKPAVSHFRTAGALADRAGLEHQLAMIKLELGVAFMFVGQLEKADAIVKESLDLFQRINQPYRVLGCIHNLAIIQMQTGNFDAALALLDQAFQANDTLDSPTSFYALATTQGVIHILRAEYNQVIELLSPFIEMDTPQIFSGLWVEILQELAWCYYELGAYDLALEHCQNAIAHHQFASATGRAPAFALLALLQIQQGKLKKAEESVKAGWQDFDLEWQTYPGWWETISILEAEAELKLAQGKTGPAASCVKQLLEKHEELKLDHLKPGVFYLQARIALAAGNQKKAIKILLAAIRLSDESNAHHKLWSMCGQLSELELKRGNDQIAAELRARAVKEVIHIADHAGTTALRDLFLSRPDVQIILDEK